MEYKFYRKESDQWEKVEPVLWQWIATYNDKTTLLQYGEDGIFHQTNEIDFKKLELFVMQNTKTGQKILVPFTGEKLIFQYKCYIFNAGTPNEKREREYIFGFGNRIFYINYENNIVLVDNLKKVL